MVIYRHDEAHRIIINAVNKGRKGSCLKIVDVGTATTLGNLGVHHKCIPKQELPTNMLTLHTADPDGLRTKLRPDTMMVELQEHEQLIYHRAASSTTHNVLPSSVTDLRLGRGRHRKIWTVESGCCPDTRYAQEVAENNRQHEKLVHMLKVYGYDLHLRPMALGYAGTIAYNCNLSMLQDLELQKTLVKGVLKQLHMHAIKSLQCVASKRQQEKQWGMLKQPYYLLIPGQLGIMHGCCAGMLLCVWQPVQRAGSSQELSRRRGPVLCSQLSPG